MTRDDITNRFSYHAPTARGTLWHNDLNEAFRELAFLIVDRCPEGREQELAITKLEEAKFFASAGIARNPETR